MDESLFVSDASFRAPRLVGRSSRWLGHVPFAFWLVDSARPSVVVDFGTGPANAYLALCQALQRSVVGARSFAIRPADHSGIDDESRVLADLNRHHFVALSSLIRVNLDEALSRFENRSIDLLHLGGHLSPAEARHAFDRWSPKMSDRGIVLLDDTNHYRNDQSFPRLFHELSGRYRSFEFLHDRGLGVVAVGKQLPPRVDVLFGSEHSAQRVESIRQSYARLGHGLIDGRVNQSLEVVNARPLPALATPVRDGAFLDPIEEENGVLTERVFQLAGDLRDIRSSLGWAVVQKARRARMLLTPEATIRGRCWRLFTRFVKTAATAGIGVAVSKAAVPLWRRIGNRAAQFKSSTAGSKPGWSKPASPFDAFQELPWRYDQGADGRPAGSDGRFKVLLVSHEASRTGAPLCALRLAEQFARNPDFECWIVLERGGELLDEFASVAPVIILDRMVNLGVSHEELPELIVRLFRKYADSCVAICNTACVVGHYAACAANGVPVLAWVHEMPTLIDSFCGGAKTVATICRAARRIVTPADAVANALASHYKLDRDLIQTIYNGLVFEINSGNRPRERSRVREELGIPADARIVLGCGTIELRKGVDLFVQLAHRTLAAAPTHDTYFLWIGKVSDPGVKSWLDHDIAKKGLRDRVLFVGPRDDSEPYFLAADVFVLASREDPCPLVNMEAMASGLPVIAFRDAGGAPELLEGCGVVVPYIDVEAMTRALVHLLAHPEQRESLGRLAHAKIRSGYNWPRFADQVIRILQDEYDYRPTSGHAGRVSRDTGARELTIHKPEPKGSHHLLMRSRAVR